MSTVNGQQQRELNLLEIFVEAMAYRNNLIATFGHILIYSFSSFPIACLSLLTKFKISPACCIAFAFYIRRLFAEHARR